MIAGPGVRRSDTVIAGVRSVDRTRPVTSTKPVVDPGPRTMTVLPPVPKSRTALATYEALVESSTEEIRATGRVSAETITDRAGVSTATFYTYFTSKDHAIAVTFDRSSGRLISTLGAQLTMEALLDEGLESVVRRAVTTVAEAFRADTRIYRLAMSRLSESDMMRRVYQARETQVLEFLEPFMRRGIAAGRIRDTDPLHLARVFLVVMQGLQNPTLTRTEDPRLVDELAGMLAWAMSP